MESKITMEKSNDEIINEAFINSFQYRLDSELSKTYEHISKWDNLKFKILNMASTVKYDWICKASNLKIVNTKNNIINIYNKKYLLKNKDNQVEYDNYINQLNKKLGKILIFTYRDKFPPIKNFRNKQKYTSDRGWGCMIRSGQMILSRALYKIYKYLGFNTKTSLYKTLGYFLEYPFFLENIPDEYLTMMNKFLKKVYSSQEQPKAITIEYVYPPFGIKALVEVGQICNKAAGEWFSDVNLCYIFKIINKQFEVIDFLEIFPFQSCIYVKDIFDNCFTKDCKTFKPLKAKTNIKTDFIEKDNIKYYFYKIGIIFVSVRLGINKITNEYHDQIRELFSCKQCIGFIGGEKNKAYYFLGYDDKHYIYLDPHQTKDSINNIKSKQNIETYMNKEINYLPFKELQAALSIGFLIKNLKDYNELIEWITRYTSQEYSCFGMGYSKQENLQINENININLDIDDF